MTEIMGIVNLTPDSFSGDGMHLAPQEAFTRIDALIADGAALIDIGAESTRPHACRLSPQEEWERLAPVAQALGERTDNTRFSIDTRHAEVARKALAAGFSWINDVTGGEEPEMVALAKDTGCTIVLMHSLGVPADPKRTLAPDIDPVKEMESWMERLLEKLEKAGLARAQIILDPGIGFGKTAKQSLALIRHVKSFKRFGVPLLIGHSRKSFLSLFTDRKAAERDPETLAVSYYLAEREVDYLRVHDVKSHAAMLRIRDAL